MRQLNSAELDDMNYKRALEKLREQYNADSESLAQSEVVSIVRWEANQRDISVLDCISSLCDEPPERVNNKLDR